MAISAFIFKVTLFFCLFSQAIRAVVTSCPVMAAVELAVAGKKIHESKVESSRFWQKGKTKVWIDNNLYLAWISARTACGFVNDSSFVGHLLALENRRRFVSWNSALT